MQAGCIQWDDTPGLSEEVAAAYRIKSQSSLLIVALTVTGK